MPEELTLPERCARDLLERICSIRSNSGSRDLDELFGLHEELERIWIRHKDIDDLTDQVTGLERAGNYQAAHRLIDEIDARLREVLDLRDETMPLPEIDDLFGKVIERRD